MSRGGGQSSGPLRRYKNDLIFLPKVRRSGWVRLCRLYQLSCEVRDATADSAFQMRKPSGDSHRAAKVWGQ